MKSRFSHDECRYLLQSEMKMFKIFAIWLGLSLITIVASFPTEKPAFGRAEASEVPLPTWLSDELKSTAKVREDLFKDKFLPMPWPIEPIVRAVDKSGYICIQ